MVFGKDKDFGEDKGSGWKGKDLDLKGRGQNMGLEAEMGKDWTVYRKDLKVHQGKDLKEHSDTGYEMDDRHGHLPHRQPHCPEQDKAYYQNMNRHTPYYSDVQRRHVEEILPLRWGQTWKALCSRYLWVI